jgi:hypothetical protein
MRDPGHRSRLAARERGGWRRYGGGELWDSLPCLICCEIHQMGNISGCAERWGGS